MSDPLNDIVTVAVTAATTMPTREGFGTILIQTYHTRFPELIRRYGDISDMVADGFTSYDEAYRIAAKIKSQNPAVVQFAVGRKPTAPAFTKVVTVTSAVQGQHVQMKVVQPATGTISQIDYTIGASATTTTVAAALATLIDAVAGVDSTASAATVTVTPTVAGRPVHIYDLVNVTVKDTTAAANYDSELAALQLVDDDWYFTVIDSTSSANVQAVAAWAEASERPKMFFAETSDTTVTSTALDNATAIGAALKAGGFTRTATTFAFDSDDHVAGAYTGMGAPESPGSITWNNQQLAGVTAGPLTTNQINALKAANMNYFIQVRGVNITRGGIVASGEHIDVIHGLDALKADIQESIFAVLIGKNKVPFTKAGFTVIEGAIRGALKRFEPADQNAGGALLVYGSSSVLMPAIELVSSADKAARRLRNVKFTAQLAGAIEGVDVVGTINL